MEQRLLGENQVKWTSKLLGLDFEIQFRHGLENKAAGALSRQMMYHVVSVVHSNLWATVDAEVLEDSKLQPIVRALQQGSADYPSYSLQKGRLFYQGRVVLPRHSPQIPTLLAEFHDSPSGGHFGYFLTYKKLAGAIYWKGMKRAVKEFVVGYHICQTNKYETLSPGGLLQPLLTPLRFGPKSLWTSFRGCHGSREKIP